MDLTKNTKYVINKNQYGGLLEFLFGSFKGNIIRQNNQRVMDCNPIFQHKNSLKKDYTYTAYLLILLMQQPYKDTDFILN